MHLGIPLGDTMADMEFDLGEAMGGYEQARADRDFYLSMMQQGNQNRGAFMASPIAAYLAGVSGVKLANMRTKVQQVEDAKQAKADAIAATERAQKRFDNLQDNMFKIASAANKGDLSQGAAAAMFGHIVREAGGTPQSYDADNGILSYNLKGEDYEVDLKRLPNQLESGRNLRAAERIAWEREKQQAGIKGQKEVAAYKKSIGAGGSGAKPTDPWTTFKDANKDTIEYLQLPIEDNELLDMLPRRAAIEFIAGAEELPETRKKTLSSQIKRLKSIYNITPEEIKGITVEEQPVNLDSLW